MVTSDAPVGSEPVALEPEQWNGLWLGGEGGAAHVLVTNATGGELQIVYVDEEDNRLRHESIDVVIQHSGEQQYTSTHVEDETDGETRFQSPHPV